MSRALDGQSFSNISATTAAFNLDGGQYGVNYIATWGGGSVTLEQLAADGSTYVPVVAGFTANGSLYLIGGSDGTSPKSEVYWAVPDANGNLAGGWSHLPVMDLPAGGLQGGQAVQTGSGVFVIGGQTSGGILKSSIRASTAPQEPFFQLGIAGAVVPALQIPGEVGQQLGYLSAAGAGTLDFIILALIGWAYAHRPTISAWWSRRRGRRTA